MLFRCKSQFTIGNETPFPANFVYNKYDARIIEDKPSGNSEGGNDGDADGTDSFGSSDGKSHSGSGDDTADSDDWTGLDEP